MAGEPVPCSTVTMWMFTFLMIIGLIMTVCNICGKCIFSKFDGVILTTIGTFASIITGIKSDRPLLKVYNCGSM